MTSLSLNVTGIEQARELFGSQVVDQAVESTLNKLAAQARTAVSKEIRKTYNIKARDLNAAMKVQRVRSGVYESYILAAGPRFSLMYFDPQETVIRGNDAIITKRSGSGGLFSKKTRKGNRRRGVTVKVRKDEGRKLVKGKKGFGGFMAPVKSGSAASGNFQIFMRQGRERLPIDKLTGPAVAQMLGQKTNTVQEFIAKESGRIFSHELDFFASKVFGRG